MVIKLFRKYPTRDGKATVGQDKDGNLYARCNVCDNNMVIQYDYSKTRTTHVPKRIAVCPKCKFRTMI